MSTQACANLADVPSAFAVLLAAVPKRRRELARVRLGYPFAQVRRLERVPPVSQRIATRIVRANRDAFFMRSRGEHAIAEVWRDADGALWAAAFDESMVQEIADTLRASGWRVERFEPSRELLPPSAAERPELFAWRPPLPVDAQRVRQRVERTVVAVLISGAAVASVFGPAMRARAERTRIAAELQRSELVRGQAARSRAELTRVTASLDVIQSFHAQRRELTVLFAAIGTALPDSTAITSLHIDSTEASFVAVSPHVVDILGAVGEALPGRELRIASVVAREQLGGVRVERATFRARRHERRAAATAAPRAPLR